MTSSVPTAHEEPRQGRVLGRRSATLPHRSRRGHCPPNDTLCSASGNFPQARRERFGGEGRLLSWGSYMLPLVQHPSTRGLDGSMRKASRGSASGERWGELGCSVVAARWNRSCSPSSTMGWPLLGCQWRRWPRPRRPPPAAGGAEGGAQQRRRGGASCGPHARAWGCLRTPTTVWEMGHRWMRRKP